MQYLVDALSSFAARDLVDEDGRPCGEFASPLYQGLKTDVVACPYHDTRQGRDMNRTALAQVSRCYPEVVSTARALAGPDATVARAFSVAMIAVSAPVVHAHTYPGEPVPRRLSSFYKTGLGYSQVLSALLLAQDGVADELLTALGDRTAFDAFLDEGRWLHGETQVCAGSSHQIGDMLDALAGRSPGPGEVMPELAQLDPERIRTVAVRAVYDHAVTILTRRGDRYDGPAPWWAIPRAPWLRAVLAAPGRTVEHARRLYGEDDAQA